MNPWVAAAICIAPLWLAAVIACWHAYTTRDSNPNR